MDVGFRFCSTQPIRWRDIDAFGVVNNAVYLSLFEQARFEYFRDLGLLVAGDISFVLGETTVRYHAPGRRGMTVAVGVRTVRLGTKSFDMEFEARADGTVLVTGKATLVWVDRDLASQPIPETARERLRLFEGLP